MPMTFYILKMFRISATTAAACLVTLSFYAFTLFREREKERECVICSIFVLHLTKTMTPTKMAQ